MNENGTYTRVGLEGLWAISGVGNLFSPYATGGVLPQYHQVAPGTAAYKKNPYQFSPFAGFAWTLPKTEHPVLSWIIGKEGHSVFRSGYSIATVREGMDFMASV